MKKKFQNIGECGRRKIWITWKELFKVVENEIVEKRWIKYYRQWKICCFSFLMMNFLLEASIVFHCKSNIIEDILRSWSYMNLTMFLHGSATLKNSTTVSIQLKFSRNKKTSRFHRKFNRCLSGANGLGTMIAIFF